MISRFEDWTREPVNCGLRTADGRIRIDRLGVGAYSIQAADHGRPTTDVKREVGG